MRFLVAAAAELKSPSLRLRLGLALGFAKERDLEWGTRPHHLDTRSLDFVRRGRTAIEMTGRNDAKADSSRENTLGMTKRLGVALIT